MKAYLELSKEIYKYENVLDAVVAFSDYTYINVKDAPDYYCLEFSDAKYDLNLTMLEFENYLIDRSNDME